MKVAGLAVCPSQKGKYRFIIGLDKKMPMEQSPIGIEENSLLPPHQLSRV